MLKDQKEQSDCYQQQDQKPGSVMVWGCISALSKAHLHFCYGKGHAESSTYAYMQYNYFDMKMKRLGCGRRGYEYGLSAALTCAQKRMHIKDKRKKQNVQ